MIMRTFWAVLEDFSAESSKVSRTEERVDICAEISTDLLAYVSRDFRTGVLPYGRV